MPTFAIAALRCLHKKLQGIKLDPDYYSDPCNMITVPFPFIFSELPLERFRFKRSDFEYMGRETFSELWRTIQDFNPMSCTRLYIQGTMGYGKSHILAALASLLSRSGKRTVYLPDCGEMLANTMEYLQTALLCAFADPSSSDKRKTIRTLESLNDLKGFCCANLRMYFIIDQMNALDDEDPNEDIASNQKKFRAREYLTSLTTGHYRIISASANHKTALHMERKQTGERKLSLMGGMTKVSKYSTCETSRFCDTLFIISFLSPIERDETMVDPSQGKYPNFRR